MYTTWYWSLIGGERHTSLSMNTIPLTDPQSLELPPQLQSDVHDRLDQILNKEKRPLQNSDIESLLPSILDSLSELKLLQFLFRL